MKNTNANRETTMNLTKAAWELDYIRNNMTSENALARVDEIGRWLASQKLTEKNRKLARECHQLADKIMAAV